MMTLKRIKLLSVALGMVFLPSLALTKEQPNLVLKLTAWKEVVVKEKDGKSRVEWQEIAAIDPGDVVKYVVQYTNGGKTEAREAVIVDPIPAGTVYMAGSAEGKDAEITYSLDGKSFYFAPLLKYRVKNPDGTEKEFSATPDMYTHIRWKLTKPVPPGGTGTVSFKVKVK